MDRLIEVAKDMEMQDEEADKLAKKIVTAYRKVERSKEDIKLAATGKMRVQLKADHRQEQKIESKQQQQKPRQNRTIQQQKKIVPKADNVVLTRPSSARKPNKTDEKPVKYKFREEEREFQIFSFKLLCQKLTKLRHHVGLFYEKLAMNKLKAYFKLVTEKQNDFIIKRAKKLMSKYFNLLAKQTIILKIEKENERLKKQAIRQRQQLETASDFHQYSLFKKAMKSWHRYVKQCRTEKQNKRQNQIKPKQQKPVSELKNKVSDLLATLKQDIEMGDHRPAAQIIFEQEQQHSVDEQVQVIQVRPSEMVEGEQQNERQNQVVQLEQHIPGKKLTHQELLKRRQELEKKNQDRKERLEKIKKEREQARLQHQQQKKLSEQLLKQQQAQRKRQEYQKFLKRREQQKEAKEQQRLQQLRMEKLNILADNHNRDRIMNFFGWKPWLKLIQLRNRNFITLSQKIDRCQLKLIWLHFVECTGILFMEMEGKDRIKAIKADVLHRRHCKKQIMRVLKEYRKYYQVQKQQFLVSRCMNLQKQVFRSWRRAMPEICQQNYKEQKKTNEKIQEYLHGRYLRLCFKALKDNTEQQKRERLLAHHTKNLRGKILQWTKQQKPFDINNLLE